jgi:catechol 2,3-dioxygenase-like lactoylglutathione lyase family enzyme
MITNISLVTLWVTDQDEAKNFYVGTLGFTEGADVKMGDGFRWVTVGHPDHPELQVTLMVPGPPLDDGMADAVRRALANGTMKDSVSRAPTATRRTRSCPRRASTSCSRRRTGPTASRP